MLRVVHAANICKAWRCCKAPRLRLTQCRILYDGLAICREMLTATNSACGTVCVKKVGARCPRGKPGWDSEGDLGTAVDGRIVPPRVAALI